MGRRLVAYAVRNSGDVKRERQVPRPMTVSTSGLVLSADRNADVSAAIHSTAASAAQTSGEVPVPHAFSARVSPHATGTSATPT